MDAFNSRALHVINGDSAGSSFAQAFGLRDQLVIHRDVLSCGPTPAATLAEWRERRSEFWRSLLDGDLGRESAEAPPDLWDSVDRLRDASEVYVWAATGNTDQLTIAFLLHVMRLSGADPAKLRVVEFDRVGAGELIPDEWKRHPPPRALTAAELNDHREAWDALTSSDTQAIVTFVASHPGAPEHLVAALRRVLLRYPSRQTGLNEGDLRLLDNVRQFGPKAARVIGHAMAQAMELGDLEGDLYVFSRVFRMEDSRLPRPLLTLSGAQTSMRDTLVALTAFAIDVLEGRQCFHPVNPIDDWAGGVHLSSANGNLWFYDNGRIVRG
jgi:hypothetical protein